METTEKLTPQARNEGLLVRELADELLVYDLERHRAHALNRTAAWVWRHCDGKTSVAEMAASLHRDLGAPSNEEAIWLALQRLGKAHLLEEKLPPRVNGASSSRRALMRNLAMASGLALVTSITAPEAQANQSCIASGTPGCTPTTNCCSGRGNCNNPGKCK
jgi:hypothetical protein